MQKWQQHHWKIEKNQCDKSLSSFGHSPTDVMDTAGAYLALSAGVAVALMVLILEIVIKYLRENYK